MGRRNPVDRATLPLPAGLQPRRRRGGDPARGLRRRCCAAPSDTTSRSSAVPDKMPMPLQVHRRAGDDCPCCGARVEARGCRAREDHGTTIFFRKFESTDDRACGCRLLLLWLFAILLCIWRPGPAVSEVFALVETLKEGPDTVWWSFTLPIPCSLGRRISTAALGWIMRRHSSRRAAFPALF
jgi:hypothetical protein